MAVILVVGASRGIGLETVKSALEAGHEVRAFARSAATIPLTRKLENLGAEAKPTALSLDKLTSSLDQTGAIDPLWRMLRIAYAATPTIEVRKVGRASAGV